ncbi:hypothetical protein TNCV_3386651 [Trichonephila clavipes]|nr:hypothetical protein TNCV_3386651 [Trichonephila clavipes]
MGIIWRIEVARIPKKIGDSCPLDEYDLFEFITFYDYKEVDNDEIEGEAQPLISDLIREGLKFATSMEQHLLTPDSDVQRALKFLRNHKFCVVGYLE